MTRIINRVCWNYVLYLRDVTKEIVPDELPEKVDWGFSRSSKTVKTCLLHLERDAIEQDDDWSGLLVRANFAVDRFLPQAIAASLEEEKKVGIVCACVSVCGRVLMGYRVRESNVATGACWFLHRTV